MLSYSKITKKYYCTIDKSLLVCSFEQLKKEHCYNLKFPAKQDIDLKPMYL